MFFFVAQTKMLFVCLFFGSLIQLPSHADLPLLVPGGSVRSGLCPAGGAHLLFQSDVSQQGVCVCVFQKELCNAVEFGADI